MSPDVKMITDRLAALAAQTEAVQQAHQVIHCELEPVDASEIDAISRALRGLCLVILEKEPAQKLDYKFLQKYHAELDDLIQRADRMLEADHEIAERLLQISLTRQYLSLSTGLCLDNHSHAIHGHMAMLEAFVATVRGTAHQALSVAMRRTA